jgi:hypothetical protein
MELDERTAYHEAGHAVVGTVLGKRVLRIDSSQARTTGSAGLATACSQGEWRSECSPDDHIRGRTCRLQTIRQPRMRRSCGT